MLEKINCYYLSRMIGKTFLFRGMSEALYFLKNFIKKNNTPRVRLWFAAIKSITGKAPGPHSAKSFPLQATKLNLGYLRHQFIWILITLLPYFKHNSNKISGYCAWRVSRPLPTMCFIFIKTESAEREREREGGREREALIFQLLIGKQQKCPAIYFASLFSQ